MCETVVGMILPAVNRLRPRRSRRSNGDTREKQKRHLPTINDSIQIFPASAGASAGGDVEEAGRGEEEGHKFGWTDGELESRR